MKSDKGFTLLEVLVSVAIMGLIMAIVWSSTSQSLNSKERIEKRDMIYQNGRVALQKLADDLTMAFLTKKPAGPAAALEAEGTTPVQMPAEIGLSPKPITFFIGNDAGNRDDLSFTSFSHLRFLSGSKESDQCKVGYEVAPSAENPGQYNLTRKEIPWLDSKTEIEIAPLILAENIRDFDLEYYDGRKEEWIKIWNTEQIDYAGFLPKAVRVYLSFPDPDDEEKSITMATVVLLPMSAGLINF